MDNLKLLFGEPLIIDGITFRHPKIDDVIDVGEDFYMSAVNLFIVRMSDLMVELYDCGIDYRNAKPFEVFLSLTTDTLLMEDGKFVADRQGMPIWNKDSSTSKKLGWLTGIEDFRFHIDSEGKCSLYSPSSGFTIDESVYKVVRLYYSKMHTVSSDEKYNPGNDQTLKFLVRQEKRKRELNARKPHRSELASRISSYVCLTGCTFDDVRNLYVYQFFDGLARVNKLMEYKNISMGYFCGNIKHSDYQRAIEKVDWTQ